MAKSKSSKGKPRPDDFRFRITAGGIVFRRKGGGFQVALIRAKSSGGKWQIPKGHVDAGETLKETARREVREETGLDADVMHPLQSIQYWFFVKKKGKNIRVHKTVHFYLLKYHSGNIQDHDDEVEEARWVPLSQAEALLAFDNEKQVLRKAKELLTAV